MKIPLTHIHLASVDGCIYRLTFFNSLARWEPLDTIFQTMENIQIDKRRQDVRVQPWQPNEGYNKTRDNFGKPSTILEQGSQGKFQHLMGTHFNNIPNKFNMLEEENVQYNTNMNNNDNKSNILSLNTMKEGKPILHPGVEGVYIEQ